MDIVSNHCLQEGAKERLQRLIDELKEEKYTTAKCVAT